VPVEDAMVSALLLGTASFSSGPGAGADAAVVMVPMLSRFGATGLGPTAETLDSLSDVKRLLSEETKQVQACGNLQDIKGWDRTFVSSFRRSIPRVKA
jgi:hypothetical protein